MRRQGEAETVRACVEAGVVRTRRKPAAASEGEAKEDHLNACKSYNIVGMEGVVGLTQRFRDLVKHTEAVGNSVRDWIHSHLRWS